MSEGVTTVSDHSGDSTPRTADSPTPDRYAPGFQPYASWTSMSPAHDRPMGVELLYFMSRYALFAGDRITLLPRETAVDTPASDVEVPQNCGVAEAGRVAFAMSCQPTTCLPVAATRGRTLFTNVR